MVNAFIKQGDNHKWMALNCHSCMRYDPTSKDSCQDANVIYNSTQSGNVPISVAKSIGYQQLNGDNIKLLECDNKEHWRDAR